jgi:hypothetical protein
MSFDVSNEIKQQLLMERIQSLNLEGYQNQLNLKAAEALGNQEIIDQATANIAVITTTIAVHESELADLA